MEVTTAARVPIQDRSQVALVRSIVQEAAKRGKLSEESGHRAGIVATELGTNLFKHATGGEVLIRLSTENASPVVEVIALDRGPGIADVARALTDGHSTSGSAGTGLGAVRRLATTFDIYSSGRGTVILARIGDATRGSAKPTFDVGVVSVPKQGESVCGDGWLAEMDAERLRALVIDGLGHGPGAYDAARSAMDVFAGGPALDCAQVLARIHQGIRHTRGGAGSVVDLRAGSREVAFAGIGNVTGAIWSDGSVRQLPQQNGTLGHQAPTPRTLKYPWTRESLLVMHSDGLTSHWSLDQSPGLGRRHPTVIAAVLYRDFSRQRDDVTVLVAREAA